MEEGRWKKEDGRRKKEDGRRKMEEGRWKKEDGRRKMEEGRGKKEEVIIVHVSAIKNVLTVLGVAILGEVTTCKENTTYPGPWFRLPQATPVFVVGRPSVGDISR